MESNIYNGTKTDFSYFVRMALKDNMPWKTLTILLQDLAPTLKETREVISILLRELESLQSILHKKEKELAKYQNYGPTPKIQKNTLEAEIITNEKQSIIPENEMIEDEIEDLEVVKETLNEEMYGDMDKGSKPIDNHVNENDEDDLGEAEENMDEIDNEWYTLVKNAKSSVPETDDPVQEKEFYLETKPSSSNESKNDNHLAEENENCE